MVFGARRLREEDVARHDDVLGDAGPAAEAEPCLLYTSDAADERSSVDLGGRRIIKKKKRIKHGAVALSTNKRYKR